MLRTKIVCTIGPASRDPQVLARLIAAGMDVARLNFSHGDHAFHAENIHNLRQASAEAGKAVAILVDLQGPKLRVGALPSEGLTLEEKELVLLSPRADAVAGEVEQDSGAKVIPVQFQRLAEAVEPGYRILLDDGLLELTVEAVQAPDVRCRVLVGGVLTSNKGINLPRAALSIPAITEKDKEDLRFALEHQADWIALSFVRRAQEVLDLKQLIQDLSPFGRLTPVIAKIEKPEALDNIDEIIAAADGIMVARGDLGIEMAPESVPMIQKMIIKKCNQAGVPVITATQMLDSMIRNPRPTRAEASDVANAILDGTDAIMLSGETAVGKYPEQAVRTMRNIAMQAEQVLLANASVTPPKPGRVSLSSAVSHAAVDIANLLNASAILAPTASGATARQLSHLRPISPVIAITPSVAVQHQLALHWGVTPLISRRAENTDEMFQDAIKVALDRELVKAGDIVVITGGSAGAQPGTTDLVKVIRLPRRLACGEGVGTRTVVGRLRKLVGPLSDEVVVRYDEIVVTPQTDRTFVKPLRNAAGLISGESGPDCHSYLLANELGLSAVLGVSNLDELPEGEWVTLSPELGLVVERSDIVPRSK
ncbi:MAG: pyruvate kinase [Caldilineales bacterium]|nr:pyruvate kinase [Caldilineales bacterium]MDW8319155.1 pyruvate kinase [Anaerolineae bacterium]